MVNESKMAGAMKPLTCLFLLLTIAALAKDKPSPADYPLIAHVISVGDQRTGGGATSSYDAAGHYSYGHVTPHRVTMVRLRIDKRIYTTEHGCRKVEVGSDLHARLEGKHLLLLTDEGEACKTRIAGVEEIP
jgi:hypothetical protein